jgi:hypothetical protein
VPLPAGQAVWRRVYNAAMSTAHARYLFVEQVIGAAVVNFVLNALIAWGLFGRLGAVPLWGEQSIAGDLFGTAFLLPFLTCLIVTPTARRQVAQRGFGGLGWSRTSHPWLRALPARTAWRGVVLGGACVVAVAPFLLGTLDIVGVQAMSVRTFVLFKGLIAAGLAAVVTPIIALWAIAEVPPGPTVP